MVLNLCRVKVKRHIVWPRRFVFFFFHFREVKLEMEEKDVQSFS